jgi:outer membrane lipopolysaccharide assembly protein LptE/RlpB
METEQKTLKQKKIELAQGEYAPVVIELIKDLISKDQQVLIGDTEYETVVNAVRLDTHGTIIRGMVDYLESIRKGSLNEVQM